MNLAKNLELTAELIGYCIMGAACFAGLVAVFGFILNAIWRRVTELKEGTKLTVEFLKWKRAQNNLRESAQSAEENSDGI